MSWKTTDFRLSTDFGRYMTAVADVFGSWNVGKTLRPLADVRLSTDFGWYTTWPLADVFGSWNVANMVLGRYPIAVRAYERNWENYVGWK